VILDSSALVVLVKDNRHWLKLELKGLARQVTIAQLRLLGLFLAQQVLTNLQQDNIKHLLACCA
jgi:hypothetical protein